MPTPMPLPTRISQGAQKRVKQRVHSARFGDGYFQTAPDGINSVFAEWDISWEALTSAERTTVVTALLAVGAVDYITWTPPGEVTEYRFQVVPDSVSSLYTEQVQSGQYFNISTSLVQVR